MQKRIFLLLILAVPIVLVCFSASSAMAEGVLNSVQTAFQSASQQWGPKMEKYASGMFGALAVINIVWTLFPVLFRQAAFGEVFGELLRIIVFTGFFLFILQNGSSIANSIISNMSALGSQAGGTTSIMPSDIVDLGHQAYMTALKAKLNPAAGTGYSNPNAEETGTGLSSNNPKPSPDGKDSIGAYFLCLLAGIAVYVLCCLIAIRVMLELITCWFVAYAGIFFLGFGGNRFTMDMAIGYLRYALGCATSLMTMYLLIGIGMNIIKSSATLSALADCNVDTFYGLMITTLAIFMLITRVPPLINSIITGGSTGSAFGQMTSGAVYGGVMSAAKSLKAAANKLRPDKNSGSKAVAAAQKNTAKAGH
ncbi:MAG: P-type conjugative transfer protein TrbL [Lachnospiraceae bacterium]|nr:P-type conjugative transfer protein TrbL [Lachnospiraceae bacterium]